MKNKLLPNQLRKIYPPDEFKTITATLPEHRKAIIGQDRAVRALQFGLGNRAPGFNVYVSAPSGDEKLTIVQHFLTELAEKAPVPPDWCYVNRFSDPYFPNALKLPKGKAREFKGDIQTFIGEAKKALVKTLESEEYAEKQNRVKQELAEDQQALFAELNEAAQKENFLIQRTPFELVVVPRVSDQPMTEKQFQALSAEEREDIIRKQREFQNMLRTTIRKSKELEKQVQQQLAGLEQKAALFAIEDLLEELLKKYEHTPEVPEYLDGLKADILDNLPLFLQENGDEGNMGVKIQMQSLRQRYEVNVLVDNSELENAPIIAELNPTYNNLFGKIERESIMGILATNFTLIRAGSLHRANGGYLILPVEDLLMAPFSWENLKRALRNQCIEIEDPTEKLGFISTKSLKPESIPLDVQVILIGRHRLFQLLYLYDDDFKELFKVKAEFDSDMPASRDNMAEICGLIYATCQEESLLPVTYEALARLIEYGHRLAEHQEKITTQLEDIIDMLREAHCYARAEGAERISAGHIRKAIEEKTYRSDLIHEKIKELIARQTIIIDLEGQKTAQINGLSVLDLGDIAFGRPSRITASFSLGQEGIIDIERESNMGGPTHTKGVLILSGFLFDKFGKDKPLTLSVRLVFEQSYGGVEGDSASSAELYAILSGLADLPIRQGIAVTGSVNQRGEIQAVGGINEKVEGFFEVCRQKGLTGEQGVLIPASNVPNLMLKEEMVDAVAQGQFHIWAIDSIDEGIEILTGVKAGVMRWEEATGRLSFDEGSVYDLANNHLKRMADRWKKFGAKGMSPLPYSARRVRRQPPRRPKQKPR